MSPAHRGSSRRSSRGRSRRRHVSPSLHTAQPNDGNDRKSTVDTFEVLRWFYLHALVPTLSLSLCYTHILVWWTHTLSLSRKHLPRMDTPQRLSPAPPTCGDEHCLRSGEGVEIYSHRDCEPLKVYAHFLLVLEVPVTNPGRSLRPGPVGRLEPVSYLPPVRWVG